MTWPIIDQRPDADVTRLPTRTLRVEQRNDVIGTSEIVVAPDASTETHASVQR